MPYVLHLSESDIHGGAAHGASRVHSGLRKIGIDSEMLVLRKGSADDSVKAVGDSLNSQGRTLNRVAMWLDNLPLHAYRQRRKVTWSTNCTPNAVYSRVRAFKPEIVHIHWVGFGFLPIQVLAKFNVPIVWTLRDAWPFTGGCHYFGDCRNYQDHCGKCPTLGSRSDYDLSRWILTRKQKYWSQTQITLVGLSHWIASAASGSSLFRNNRIEVIPNGIDAEIYQPVDKRIARDILQLPQNRRLILYGAVDSTGERRKGYQQLKDALTALASAGLSETVDVIVFGNQTSRQDLPSGFDGHYLGYLHDDITLALVYSAADVLVAPSLQEALGNVAIEAMACGTPCVAFDGTGFADTIVHSETGYLAKPFDTDDLARGIKWVLEDPERRNLLGAQARKRIEQHYTLESIAWQYANLYAEVLDAHRARTTAASPGGR